jgi:DnaJ-class molecular chaperone
MGLFERLGDMIRGYLNEDAGFGGASRGGGKDDPDVEAAFEELEEFLGRRMESGGGETAWGKARRQAPGENPGAAFKRKTPAVPESLRKDFSELGLPFGASAEECKTAYKKLLKIHHPDRHAGHEQNIRKATEKSARINAAFDRIARWRMTGRTD